MGKKPIIDMIHHAKNSVKASNTAEFRKLKGVALEEIF